MATDSLRRPGADRPPSEIGRNLGRYHDVVQSLAHAIAERGDTLVLHDRRGAEVVVLLPAARYRQLVAAAAEAWGD